MKIRPNRLYSMDDFSCDDINVGDIVLAFVKKYIPPTLYCYVNHKEAVMDISAIDQFGEGDDVLKEKRRKTAISLVGKKIVARVSSIDKNGTIHIERKSIMAETIVYLSQKIGSVVTCSVESIAPFGLFVDLGCGFVSLIPNREIAKSRYYELNPYFKVGEVLDVKITGFDEENEVFMLSRKDAYHTLTESELPSQSCIIVRIHKFVDEAKSGVYIEYNPGNAGIMDFPEEVDVNKIPEGSLAVAKVRSIVPGKGIKAMFLRLLEE